MSPEELGADIFKKWNQSHYVTKEIALQWIERAKKQMAQELEYGFYKAEMAAFGTGNLKQSGKGEA